jgi:CHASE2 domain-containing sensor protein
MNTVNILTSFFKKIPKKHLIKIFFFYLAIKGLLTLSGFFFQLSFMSVPRLEFEATSDLCLNDLHYRIKKDMGGSHPSENIVLINSGDLSIDSFRYEFASLISTIDFYEPSVIGIDHYFQSDTTLIGTRELIRALNNNSRLVLGNFDSVHSIHFNGVTYGNVMFPEHFHTVRRYYKDPGSFAAQMATKMGYTIDSPLLKNESFGLNFIAQDFSELDFDKSATLNFRFSNEAMTRLPLYKASDIIGSHDVDFARELFRNKAVIIGHFGSRTIRNIRNDLEDKFAVPCDSNLIYRQKTMPGALIHANALENLIAPSHMFLVLSDFGWFWFLEELMIILYVSLLLFFPIGKALNILFLFVVSIPTLFLTLLLMHYGYYIEISGTLLQLLVYEELVEIITPVYTFLKRRLSKLTL